MIVDHLGIAVGSLEAGIEQWEKAFGYKQMTEIVINRRQKVRVVFLAKKDSLTVKLIEPTDQQSTIYSFVKRGGGLHHICFKCGDVDTEIARLKENGVRVLVRPQPGEAFEGENIAFVLAKNNLNIELIDTCKKAGML